MVVTKMRFLALKRSRRGDADVSIFAALVSEQLAVKVMAPRSNAYPAAMIPGSTFGPAALCSIFPDRGEVARNREATRRWSMRALAAAQLGTQKHAARDIVRSIRRCAILPRCDGLGKRAGELTPKSLPG
jgi:hypothetical protein